jgi:peptidoglycan/LPS O-acetylase OafA/YrhL
MNTSRSILPMIAGWLCLVVAVILLAFSVFMFLVQTPPQICIAIGCTSLFPALVAVACLLPKMRTMALRCIGAVVCLGCLGAFVVSFVSPPRDGEGRPRRGILLVVAIAGGAMAIKGKWPGRDTNELASEPKSV